MSRDRVICDSGLSCVQVFSVNTSTVSPDTEYEAGWTLDVIRMTRQRSAVPSLQMRSKELDQTGDGLQDACPLPCQKNT